MIPIPELKTDRLGGVDIPSAEALLAMREESYILHACGGKLTRVPAEKTILPHDRKANPQTVQCGVRRSPGGDVYAMLDEIVCKSGDGGRSWISHPSAGGVSSFDVRRDGAFVAVRGPGERGGAVEILVSTDEGRSWQTTAQLAVPREFDLLFRSTDNGRTTHRVRMIAGTRTSSSSIPMATV